MERALMGIGCVSPVAIGILFAIAHEPLPENSLRWPPRAAMTLRAGNAVAEPGVADVVGQGWQILHIGAKGCRCSKDVAEATQARAAASARQAENKAALLSGSDANPVPTNVNLRTDWLNVEELSPAALAEVSGLPPEEAFLSVPALVVRNAQGRLLYAGGYDPEPIYEQAILRELAKEGRATRRPIAGCRTNRAGQNENSLRTWLRKAMQQGVSLR